MRAWYTGWPAAAGGRVRLHKRLTSAHDPANGYRPMREGASRYAPDFVAAFRAGRDNETRFEPQSIGAPPECPAEARSGSHSAPGAGSGWWRFTELSMTGVGAPLPARAGRSRRAILANRCIHLGARRRSPAGHNRALERSTCHARAGVGA